MHFTKAGFWERLHLFALHVAGVADALVYILTWTMLSTELRTKVLFSEWFSDL